MFDSGLRRTVQGSRSTLRDVLAEGETQQIENGTENTQVILQAGGNHPRVERVGGKIRSTHPELNVELLGMEYIRQFTGCDGRVVVQHSE